jgi:hypothetical protein
MNYKEEAEREINDFYKLESLKMDDNGRMSYPLAKQCALLRCEKQINEWQNISDLKSIIVIDNKAMSVVDKIWYWRKLKTEIENS